MGTALLPPNQAPQSRPPSLSISAHASVGEVLISIPGLEPFLLNSGVYGEGDGGGALGDEEAWKTDVARLTLLRR